MKDEEIPNGKKQPQDLKLRTTDFALRIIRLYASLPKSVPAQVVGKQLLRSGTSVGAQYREGHRAKSDADVVNKFEGVLQELDETDYWLELLTRAGIVSEKKLALLVRETNELIAIFVTIITNLKRKQI